MAEPLKNLYNPKLIESLCNSLSSMYHDFNSEQFTKNIFDAEWEKKELKSRMKHISVNLREFLPTNYKNALKILKSVASNFNGFEFMFFPGYVELYGLEDFEESIIALEHFTEFSSSEFAVRPFIKKYPEKMMDHMEKWAGSENHHVRRLATEGCRPRLPWAMALPEFKKNPDPVIRILQKLKNDESGYVRKSVANNLNDISKDNPQKIIELSRKWLGNNEKTDKLIKHACRTLLKQGNTEILQMFGFTKPNHIKVTDFKVHNSVSIGEQLYFSLILFTPRNKLGKLRIEYAIDFMKKNGKLSRKIFKISEANYSGQKKTITKKHSFRLISTRKYYIGHHGITVIINGKEIASGEFTVNN